MKSYRSYIAALGVSAAMLAAPAMAADMDMPGEAVFIDWTGLYLGAHIGGGRSNIDWDYAITGATADHRGSGVIGGLQLGYNWQVDGWVFGAETDFSLSGIDGSTACPNPAFTCETDAKWLATVRGRLGYAFDNVLAYATAGLGVGRFETQTVSAALGTNGETKTDTGWVAGAGVEYAFTTQWSVKAEYMYYDFGSKGFTVDNGLGVSVDTRFHTGKIGINYKF